MRNICERVPRHGSATTIQEVVDGLAGEVQRAKEQKDRVGYFASLYRQVTVAIQHDVATRAFDDNERVDHYDACFANRYFPALGGWRNSADGVPATWRGALTATHCVCHGLGPPRRYVHSVLGRLDVCA